MEIGPNLQGGGIFFVSPFSSREHSCKQRFFNTHKWQPLQVLLQCLGVVVVFLPPYSPSLDPVELFFQRIKLDIRRRRAEVGDDVLELVADICWERGDTSYRGAVAEAGYNEVCL